MSFLGFAADRTTVEQRWIVRRLPVAMKSQSNCVSRHARYDAPTAQPNEAEWERTLKKTLYIACVAAAAGLSLGGCGTITPKAIDLQTADFGPAPDQTAIMSGVKAWMDPKLKDPMSATYQCGNPRRAWTNVFGNLTYGWEVNCMINARNSFGGYVGAKPYGFLFKDGRVVQDAWANIGYVN